ncbi:hypothetical protein TYRP_007585 [Tyrophagus putrescentiae]|nr:hypothetical protein TYRP_007585 [Tyrophagus putrescentiae]
MLKSQKDLSQALGATLAKAATAIDNVNRLLLSLSSSSPFERTLSKYSAATAASSKKKTKQGKNLPVQHCACPLGWRLENGTANRIESWLIGIVWIEENGGEMLESVQQRQLAAVAAAAQTAL